ncbi:hypothetical protein [Pontibacter sp. H249]|uniref:hypothetical protein n=1 Tax=Pontibacter sp. H249 TaxID=3133420 RepID=UPI0030BFA57A
MNKLIYACFFIAISILFTPAANAQANTNYLKAINEAELYISDSLFSNALKSYGQAFALNPAASALDYYNAAVSATLTGNHKKAYTYLSTLKCKGIPLEKLQERQDLKALVNGKEWDKFARKYASISNKCNIKIDLAYRDTLLAMVEVDQYYAKKRSALTAKGSDPELYKIYADSLEFIVDSNMDAFLSLVARKGFPSEKVVGATGISVHPFYNVLIRHAVQQKRSDMLPVLLAAVQRGEFPAHVYADHAEMFEPKKYGTTVLRGSAKTMHDITFTEAEELNIDRVRDALGMEPLKDLRKKARFSLRDSRFMINKQNSTIRFFESREEMLQYRQENKL